MKYSSRFFLYAPIALFLGLAVWVIAHWWVSATAFDRKLTALKGHEAVAGVTLDWSKVTLSGFPFRIDAVFDGFVVQGAGAHGPFTWTAEHFALHALTYGRDKDVFEAAGRQTLAWTDAKGTSHALAFLPASLRASAIRDAKGLTRFDLDILDAGAKDFTAGHLQFHLRRDPAEKAIDLMVSADEIKAAHGVAFLGPHVRKLRLYAGLTQSQTFAPLLRGQDSAGAADAAWRQAGGELRVDKLEVESSNLTVSATGNVLQSRFAPLLDALY